MLEEALELEERLVVDAFQSGLSDGIEEKNKSFFLEGYTEGLNFGAQLATLSYDLLSKCNGDKEAQEFFIVKQLATLGLENTDENALNLTRIISKYKVMMTKKKSGTLKNDHYQF